MRKKKPKHTSLTDIYIYIYIYIYWVLLETKTKKQLPKPLPIKFLETYYCTLIFGGTHIYNYICIY